jgi:hypothetical protein
MTPEEYRTNQLARKLCNLSREGQRDVLAVCYFLLWREGRSPDAYRTYRYFPVPACWPAFLADLTSRALAAFAVVRGAVCFAQLAGWPAVWVMLAGRGKNGWTNPPARSHKSQQEAPQGQDKRF